MSAPIVLVVLDGFGIGDGGANDATALAQTPFFTHARATYPSATLETSGEFVGLPPGQMGNSEVGHEPTLRILRESPRPSPAVNSRTTPPSRLRSTPSKQVAERST